MIGAGRGRGNVRCIDVVFVGTWSVVHAGSGVCS